MTKIATPLLSEEQFHIIFIDATERYKTKIKKLFYTATDAAVASASEARLPFFASQLLVASYLQHYVAAVTHITKYKILNKAYQLYIQSFVTLQ